jgi:hypothetical protein
MEPQESVPKRANNGQLNLNTWLLAICVGLSGWLLYSVNQLDSEVAGMMPLINQNASAIQGVNNVNSEQSKKIDDLLIRLTKLETIQADHSNKN